MNFWYSTPQSLRFTSLTRICNCICFRICVCIPSLIILVIPAAVPPHLSCCECSVQGWLVKACMQALLASYHALVHFLATALLLFVLYIRAFIYIFYVIHYSNPVAPFSSKSGHSKHFMSWNRTLLYETQKWICLWYSHNSNLPNCRILTSITNSAEICFKCIWHKLCFHKVVQKPPSIQNFQLRLIKSLQKTAWKVKLFERKDDLQGGKIGQSKLILASCPEFRLSQWGCIAFALDVIVWRKQ